LQVQNEILAKQLEQTKKQAEELEQTKQIISQSQIQSDEEKNAQISQISQQQAVLLTQIGNITTESKSKDQQIEMLTAALESIKSNMTNINDNQELINARKENTRLQQQLSESAARNAQYKELESKLIRQKQIAETEKSKLKQELEARENDLSQQVNKISTKYNASVKVLLEGCKTISNYLEKLPSIVIQINGITDSITVDLGMVENLIKQMEFYISNDTSKNNMVMTNAAKRYPPHGTPDGVQYLKEVDGKILTYMYSMWDIIRRNSEVHEALNQFNNCKLDIDKFPLLNKLDTFIDLGQKVFEDKDKLMNVIKVRSINGIGATSEDILHTLSKYSINRIHADGYTSTKLPSNTPKAPKMSNNPSKPAAIPIAKQSIERQSSKAIVHDNAPYLFSPEKQEQIINNRGFARDEISNLSSIDPDIMSGLNSLNNSFSSNTKNIITGELNYLIDVINNKLFKSAKGIQKYQPPVEVPSQDAWV
jgi:hypothetical protein